MNILDRIAFTEHSLKLPYGTTPENVATLIRISMNSSYAVFAFYEACAAGVESVVIDSLRSLGMTDRAISNLKSVATNVVPFMIEHNLQSNCYTVKDAIAAMRTKDGVLIDSPLVKELMEVLRDPKTTQIQVRAIRAKYPYPKSR